MNTSDGHKGGACNHRRCPEGDCQALTPEALEPDTDDLALGQQLGLDGWSSVSTRYRTVARLKRPWPGLEIIAAEWRDHPYGQYAADQLSRFGPWVLRAFASGKSSDLVETRELTIRQWRAFKKSGGKIA